MPTRVDVPDTPSCWQADVPDPTRILRGSDGLRRHRVVRRFVRNLRRQSRIAKQNVAAIFEANAQGLAEEQGGEAAAVDEEVARDLARLLGGHTADVTGFRLIDLRDIRENVAHAQLLGAVLREERGEFAGVQVVGVVGHRLVFRAGDQLRRQALITEAALGCYEIAEALIIAAPQPMRHEVDLSKPVGKHERMVVGIIRRSRSPARELTALLECGIAVLEEIRL